MTERYVFLDLWLIGIYVALTRCRSARGLRRSEEGRCVFEGEIDLEDVAWEYRSSLNNDGTPSLTCDISMSRGRHFTHFTRHPESSGRQTLPDK